MRLNLLNTFKQSVKTDNILFCFGPKNTRHTKKIFALLENNLLCFFLNFLSFVYTGARPFKGTGQVSQTFHRKRHINDLCEALQ